MSNVWERFDGIASVDDVEKAKSSFTPIEAGEYRMVLEELEPSQSQNGLPMLKGKFRVLENNRVVFYNQMLQNISTPTMTAVNIAEAVAFVGKLKGEDVEFTTLSEFANIVSEVVLGEEYNVLISYGKKDLEMKYPKLHIMPETVIAEPIADDDIPF